MSSFQSKEFPSINWITRFLKRKKVTNFVCFLLFIQRMTWLGCCKSCINFNSVKETLIKVSDFNIKYIDFPNGWSLCYQLLLSRLGSIHVKSGCMYGELNPKMKHVVNDFLVVVLKSLIWLSLMLMPSARATRNGVAWHELVIQFYSFGYL